MILLISMGVVAGHTDLHIVGAVIALIGQSIWFPLIGKEFTNGEQLATLAFFTTSSVVRVYVIRRLCNGRSIYQTIRRKFKCTNT